MYSVLIADDFFYDRKALADMVASFVNLPLCIVGQCDNGFEALEAIHNLHPDILLCDVEMPNMNGVELANTLRAEGARTRIVFCSLYDKIHYLQAAIQLNCDGYLMKPIVREELEVCLKQILLRLLDVKAQQDAFSALHKAMAEKRVGLIKEFFSDLLMDNDFSEEYLQHRLRLLGLDESLRFRLAVLELNLAGSISAQPTPDDSSAFSFRTYQCLKRDTGWTMPYYVIRINEHCYAVVFCYSIDQSAEETGRLTEQALNDFVLRMRSSGISMTASFGSQLSQVSDMRRQFELCRYRLNHRWQYDGDSVIFSDEDHDALRPSSPVPLQLVQDELKLLLNLESGDIRRTTLEYVTALFNGQPLFQQQMICYYLLGNVRCVIYEDDLPQTLDSSELEALLRQVMALSSTSECVSFAHDLIVRAYQLIHSNEKDAGKELIERIKQFIRASDLKSVHLRLIADHFSYSPNYLNHIFKAATDMTILDYITSCRIARAKELIQTTSKRLSEIAEEIGYSHATYLTVVFKKQEGITPKQFMERCRL